MTVALAISIAVMGLEKVETMIGISGVVTQVLPFLLAAMCALSPTTACAISMEGKQWWIVRSLPVSAKSVFDSKILVNLTIAVPCYIVSEIILNIAINMDFTQRIAIILLPLAYILFSAVLGLTANIKIPLFNWESETVPVKQGGALLVSMITGMLTAIIPAVLCFVVPEQMRGILYIAVFVIISISALVLYTSNNKKKLIDIN